MYGAEALSFGSRVWTRETQKCFQSVPRNTKERWIFHHKSKTGWMRSGCCPGTWRSVLCVVPGREGKKSTRLLPRFVCATGRQGWKCAARRSVRRPPTAKPPGRNCASDWRHGCGSWHRSDAKRRRNGGGSHGGAAARRRRGWWRGSAGGLKFERYGARSSWVRSS